MGRPQSAETKAKISAALRTSAEKNRGRKRSAEHQAKLDAASRSRSPEYREKMRAALTGRVITDEHRVKLSMANVGKKLSEATRLKLAAASTGRVVSEETRIKLGTIRRGIPSPQRGTKRSPEVRAKISAGLQGRVLSQESRAKISAALTGRKLNPEHAERFLGYWRQHSGRTSIEVAVARVLDALGVMYEEQKPFGYYTADFYIPSQNLVIECDGDYWHSLPGRSGHDRRKDTFLRNRGYRVVRLTETDINADAQACVLRGLAG